MAGERISEIVGAVKSYTYLDQAPVQRIDVRKGSTTRWSSCVRSCGRGRRDPTLRAEPAGDRGLRFRAEPGGPTWSTTRWMPGRRGRSTSTPTRRRTAASRSGIRDTGPGSLADVLPRLFEPFFTTKAPGGYRPGPAHHPQRHIRHDGRIEVESPPGRGHPLHRHPPGQGGRAVRAGRGCRRAGSGGDGQDLTSPTTRLGSNDEKAGEDP